MKEYYRQDKGQPLNVKIMQNDNQIWPASGWATVPLNNVVGLVHDLTVNGKLQVTQSVSCWTREQTRRVI